MEIEPTAGTCKYAVRVRDLRKSYASSGAHPYTVFKDVNLNLPEGTIYGLLGPSGCGKTSLLRCILGRLKVTHGTILVFGHRPGTKKSGIPGPNVGYMPQETCIYETMTIGESLRYYGVILGMSDEKIQSAIKFFVGILNLPPKDTVNAKLSGGQLRRVAFAAALLHEPRLLILDEPTVGIDPITKDRMWKHLVQLVKKNNTSIIITTHYIEEARGAHMVGLMHGHTLAEEDYTDRLLSKFNCRTLEDVFLTICCGRSDSTGNDDFNCNSEVARVDGDGDSTAVWLPRQNGKGHSKSAPEVNGVCDDDRLNPNKEKRKWMLSSTEVRVRWHVLAAVIMKNFIHLYRFPGALVFLMLLPCLQVMAAIFATSGSFSGIKLVAINEDSGHFGGQFLSYLNPGFFDQMVCNASEDGRRVLRAGEARGVVTINRNFSEAFWKRVVNGPLEDNETFVSSTIDVSLDDTDYFVGVVIRYQLLESFKQFLQALYNNNSATLNPSFATPVILFEEEAVNSLKIPAVDQVIVGAMIASAYYAPVGVAVFNLFLERAKGYLERTYVTGVSSAEIILGVMALLLLVLVPQITLIMIVAYSSLKSMYFIDIFATYVLLYFEGISGMAFGLFLSMAFDQVYPLLLTVGIVITATAGFAGYLWPLNAVHYIFRPIYYLLPFGFPSESIRLMMHHGFSFARWDIMWGFVISLIYGVFFTVFTLLLFKVRK